MPERTDSEGEGAAVPEAVRAQQPAWVIPDEVGPATDHDVLFAHRERIAPISNEKISFIWTMVAVADLGS
jgi:hypothetical protein